MTALPPQKPRLLVVDADPATRRRVRAELARRDAGADVLEAEDAGAAAALAPHCAALLLGVGAGGHGTVERLRASGFSGHLIAALDQGSVGAAVALMRAGADDVMLKPLRADEAAARLIAAAGRPGAHRSRSPAPAPGPEPDFHGFVGRSPAMAAVYERIARIAPSAAPVFVTGESGTGKELAAAAVHACSPRAAGPFVALNCGAMPRDLLESEVFGHARGAFTGAHEARPGAAETADGGTLFLDEIGEMDTALQAKLLRFLQDGRVRRVGEAQERRLDVRIVCATHRDPGAEVRAGRLREDLYYRLAVLPLHLPPLRARGEDVVFLAESFLTRFAAEERRPAPVLGETGRAALRARTWPGNVRELQNLMRRAVVLGDGAAAFADPLSATPAPEARPMPAPGAIEPFAVIEKRIIEAALAAFGGHIGKAAAALEISPSTIYRKKLGWRGAA